MAKVRKDNKGRNLRPGETQRADGSYMYVYKLGTKKKYLYDSDLASLRVKEKQINKDKDDGIRTQEAMKLTLNDMFKVYMNNNIKLKPSTRANYLYLWDFYVKEEPFANMPLPQIHRSDILAFYTKLLKHGFAINSLESINTIVHPTTWRKWIRLNWKTVNRICSLILVFTTCGTPSVPGSAKAPTMLNSFSKSWGMPISLLQWTSTPISHKRICRRRQKTLV